MKVQQTLGDPAFRHEEELWSLEAPPGFILTAHPGFRGMYFRLWAATTGEVVGSLYWPELTRNYLLSPARPEVLISHQEKLLVLNLESETRTEFPLADVVNWSISPGGTRLVIASKGRLWGFSPEHGRTLWETRLSSSLQSPITFSTDGSHFVVHHEDQFEVLRSEDGTRVLRWPRRQGEAWALCSHQQLFLSEREDGLQCWDLRCGLLKAFNPETKTHKLVLSPCERFLACLQPGGHQQLLHTDTLEVVHQDSSINVQTFSGDGQLISSGGDYGVRSLSLTDLELSHPHNGHRRPVRGLAWLPDGSLVSSGWDGRVLRWESGSSTELVRLNAPIDVMRISPDGSLLALGGSNLGIVLWDLRAHQPLELESAGHSMTTWERGKGTRDFDGWLTPAGLLDFSDDSSTLIAVLGYDYLATWGVSDGRLQLVENKPAELYYAAGGVIDPRGLLYVAMGFPETAEFTLYSWRSGAKKGLWKVPLQLTEAVIASGSGRLFVPCDEGNLTALEAISGKVIDRVELPQKCLCLGCTPKGEVAIGTEQGSVFLWRVNEPLRGPYHFPGGGLWSSALAVSPCGGKIAVGHGNGVVSVAEL